MVEQAAQEMDIKAMAVSFVNRMGCSRGKRKKHRLAAARAQYAVLPVVKLKLRLNGVPLSVPVSDTL